MVPDRHHGDDLARVEIKRQRPLDDDARLDRLARLIDAGDGLAEARVERIRADQEAVEEVRPRASERERAGSRLRAQARGRTAERPTVSMAASSGGSLVQLSPTKSSKVESRRKLTEVSSGVSSMTACASSCSQALAGGFLGAEFRDDGEVDAGGDAACAPSAAASARPAASSLHPEPRRDRSREIVTSFPLARSSSSISAQSVACLCDIVLHEAAEPDAARPQALRGFEHQPIDRRRACLMHHGRDRRGE